MREKRQGYSARKHIGVLVIFALLLAAEAGFVLYGFKKTEQDYVDSYLDQQEQFLAQLNTHLAYLLDQGAGEKELTDYMAQSVPVSGSYYTWLCREESVIFAKNEMVTKNLGESESLPVFQEVIGREGNYTRTRGFLKGNVEYVSGIVVDKSYILRSGQLEKYRMYEGVTLAVLALAMFSLLILYVQYFLKEKKRNVVVARELQEKNKVLDSMYDDLIQLNQKLGKEERQGGRDQSYDLQMAKKLLEKSERADIFPACYALIKIKMDDGQYYGKQQMLDIASQVAMDDRHVKMEIQKGRFLLFFYRTKEEEMEQLLADAQKNWKQKQAEVEIRTGSLQQGEPEREWLEQFLEGKEQDA